MRVRLRFKSKPNNYTKSCMINVADGWREEKVRYLESSVCDSSDEQRRDFTMSKMFMNVKETMEVLELWESSNYKLMKRC